MNNSIEIAVQAFEDKINSLDTSEHFHDLGVWIMAWKERQVEIDEKDMLIEALYKKIADLEFPKRNQVEVEK